MNTNRSMLQRILVVENNMIDAGVIAHALREAIPDVRVNVATSVNEAYDFLFCTGDHADRSPNLVPELILFNAGLLDKRGDELLQLLKSYSRTQSILVMLFRQAPDCIASLRDRKVIQHGALGKANAEKGTPSQFIRLTRSGPAAE